MKHSFLTKLSSLALALILCLCSLSALTACTKKEAYRNDITAQYALTTLVASFPSGNGHIAVDSDFINASAFGEDYRKLIDACEDWSIMIADDQNKNIDQIGVFHVRDASDVKTCRKIIEEYVESQKLYLSDLLDSYNPGEKPKLDNAKVTVCGNYILYTILTSDDTKSVQKAFEDLLKAE